MMQHRNRVRIQRSRAGAFCRDSTSSAPTYRRVLFILVASALVLLAFIADDGISLALAIDTAEEAKLLTDSVTLANHDAVSQNMAHTSESLGSAGDRHKEVASPVGDSVMSLSRMDLEERNQEAPAASKSKPLAKSLLSEPAPFNDADIIKLSEHLAKSPNTVVTGYFRVPSKYHSGKYDEWMKNMLSLQDAMVIFVGKEVIDQVREFRRHAWNRTVIVPLETEQLPIGTLFSGEFWQDQLDRDPEKRTHRSYQLFWIWLSKSWLTTQAIRLNFFQSDLFMWSDIGCFRNAQYNGRNMIQHREQVPPHEMIQMAHHRPNPPPEELYNDKYKRKDNFYHSGSQFAAYSDTWLKFHEYFLDTIDRFLEKNMIIVEDQAILESVCLQHPEICAYVTHTQVRDNPYFGLRYVLYHGGAYNLWRHPKVINASNS